MSKTVCFFGIYDPAYSRNRILINGFRLNGYEVVECRVDPRRFGGFKKYFELYKQYGAVKQKHFEYVIVGFPGHSIMLLARLLFGNRIIFDAFLSLFDSNVFDRKIYGLFHPFAIRDWLMDFSSCLLASIILIDTNQHINYFHDNFFVPKSKFIRVLIGADSTIFSPRQIIYSNKKDSYTVHFHGMFIPLQGIQYILGAANILRDENIYFNIVGSGQLYKDMIKLKESLALDKVNFTGKIPFELVPDYIDKSDVCLGIFGDTNKTKRVIPNKVYECIAMGKPVITAETEAIKEVFSSGRDVVLCRLADARSLANAILNIRDDVGLATKIAKNAQSVFSKTITEKQIVLRLCNDLKNKMLWKN